MDKLTPYQSYRLRKESRGCYYNREFHLPPTGQLPPSSPLTYPTPTPTPIMSRTHLGGGGGCYRPEYILLDTNMSEFQSIVEAVKKMTGDQIANQSERIKELEMRLQQQEKLAMDRLMMMQEDMERKYGVGLGRGDRAKVRRQSNRRRFELNPDYLDKPTKRKPVITNKSSLQYFKSPPNRLPESWTDHPATPLQFIYANIVNTIPNKGFREKQKDVAVAVENGMLYRGIKNVTSPYSRDAQLLDYKKHQAYLQRRRPNALKRQYNRVTRKYPAATEKGQHHAENCDQNQHQLELENIVKIGD